LKTQNREKKENEHTRKINGKKIHEWRLEKRKCKTCKKNK
jgi:hypothetical protein